MEQYGNLAYKAEDAPFLIGLHPVSTALPTLLISHKRTSCLLKGCIPGTSKYYPLIQTPTIRQLFGSPISLGSLEIRALMVIASGIVQSTRQVGWALLYPRISMPSPCNAKFKSNQNPKAEK